ncbi:rhodopsin kinase grk7-a-like isoform X2 [Styela clava]
MDFALIEDIAENYVYLCAKHSTIQRHKWIKKIRFADDAACIQDQDKLLNRQESTAETAQKDEEDEFIRICINEPIGKKVFNEFCEKESRDVQNTLKFLADMTKFEMTDANDMHKFLVKISSLYFQKDSTYELVCVKEETKEKVLFYERTNGVVGNDRLTDLARKSVSDCKSEALSVILQDAFPRYKNSENFKKYLKWKHLEKQPVTNDCFTKFRLLGRGGFGEVYAYQENITGTMYACKQINKKQMKATGSESIVLIEKLVLEKINSRFVVTLYYAYHDKTCLNLVMMLLTGGDLKFHVKKDKKNKGVNKERCKLYAAQITVGIDHLHKHNIIYRDMKPENVLLDGKGNCRIADLGLARILQEGEKITGKAGTIGYMPPEMLMKQPYAYGADWFALGCTIYEMCEGRNPFFVRDKVSKKMDQQKTIEKTCQTKESYKRDHSKDLIDLIGKLLEKNVEDRLAKDEKSAHEIRNHPYFSDMDWEKLEAGEIQPPFVPNDKEVYADDVSDIRLKSYAKNVKLDEKDEEFYERFSTGRNPIPWQQEILDSGTYEDIMNQEANKNVDTGANSTKKKSSKICTVL